MMKNKKILYGTLIVATIIIVGSGLLLLKNYGGIENASYTTQKDPSSHEEKRVELFGELKNATPFEDCDAISKQIIELSPACSGSICSELEQNYMAYMTECIGNIAAKKNDYNLCKSDEIKSGIYSKGKKFDIALGNNSMVFKSLEDHCILSFMRNFKDKNKADENFKFLCENLKDITYRDDCFEYLATLTADHDFCLSITHEDSRIICLDYFAFRNNDSSLCQSQRSKEALSILRENQVSVCEEIKRFYTTTSMSGQHQKCYIGFAIYDHNPLICDKLKWKYDSILGRESDDFNRCKRFSSD
ncbi:MAG: hypothetical protein KAQ92_04935 [Candidatus Aenigmarchaeota archaeon]|nr:hypothetical protein [Candidatus Aenigmarchaeota archaeon]